MKVKLMNFSKILIFIILTEAVKFLKKISIYLYTMRNLKMLTIMGIYW